MSVTVRALPREETFLRGDMKGLSARRISVNLHQKSLYSNLIRGIITSTNTVKRLTSEIETLSLKVVRKTQ